MGRKGDPLVEIRSQDLMPIPAISVNAPHEPLLKGLTEEQKLELECSLDGFVAIGISRPKNRQEEEAFVKKFLEGLRKLFEKENNWTFLQPLVHSMEYCVKCQLCSESCPTYVASGRKEIYRPTFRPELLRRLINKYIKGQGTFLLKITRSDIELNFTLIARLAELAYRCTLWEQPTRL